MRNKYPGVCYHCGKRVEVGAGHFDRRHGKWLTIHAECVFIVRKLKEEAREAKARLNQDGTTSAS